MATFADLVINDGASTPAAHTFKVKLNDRGLSTWEERTGGIPVGYLLVKVQTSDTVTVRKVDIDIVCPVLAAVAGANAQGFTPAAKVDYSNRSKHQFWLSQRGTQAQRTDLWAYARNILDNATIKAVITSGEEISG